MRRTKQQKNCPNCSRGLIIHPNAIELQCPCKTVWEIVWYKGYPELIENIENFVDEVVKTNELNSK